jgi:nucleoside-diphosphate-sugar epimerase
MRVLITGAGMIGCYTARELISVGDGVTFFDLAPQTDYVHHVVERALPVVRGDIRELPALVEAIQHARPDCVIHTAGLQGTRAPFFGFQVNLIGTLNVAEAVRLCAVKRLIHASSQGVYDLSNSPEKIAEEWRSNGAGRVYQGSKVACEEVLTAYASYYGFELALPRFASVYGYGPYTGGGNVGIDMHALVRAALDGKIAPMGPGIADRNDFVYVKDIAQGVRCLAHAPRLEHQVYNLGTGTCASVHDIQLALRRILGDVQFSREVSIRPRPALDISRARRELGYEPRFDIEAGLRDFIKEVQRTG